MAQTIIVFSTKGGVGKTLIAGNLAISLALDQGQRVCLIDLDLQVIRDMARMFNFNPQKAIVDLMVALKKQPEAVRKEEFLFKSAHGIDFLPGVIKPQQIPFFDPLLVHSVFSFLHKHYDYIIVDAGQNFNEPLMAVLNEANLILSIVTPDILSVYQTKTAIETLQFLHLPISMIKLVLNRAESVASISWQEIRLSLPIEVLAQIPSEGKIAGQAVNLGIPVLIDNPRSRISLTIKKLAETLVARKDLFVSHVEIDQVRVKELLPEKTGSFWVKEGMAEAPFDPSSEEALDEISRLKTRIHTRLLEELNIKRLDAKVFRDTKKNKDLRDRAQVLVTNFLVDEAGSFINSVEARKKLVNEILNEVLGFGPLEDLIADDQINDIMVNSKEEIYIERKGKITLTDKKFMSNEQLRTIMDRIISPIGRHIDESSPMVDARLPDGSRVNAVIPPLSLGGPVLTIRKFRKESFKAEELIGMKALTKEMVSFIKACVIGRKNIIVSGGTGSGKTTVLNVLSNYIPEEERIITIEDAAELRLIQEHWIRLESRLPNIEGKGAITIRDLFRNTLRMRPDRILIGECRGVETLDMLQAMNTGHDGSMTTIHANSTADVLTRLDSMILMSGYDLPIRAIREMIASAIDIIIHTTRLPDGSRKVVQLSEVAGMIDETHISLKDIFMYKQTGTDEKGTVIGQHRATGYLPSFMEEMRVRGIPLSEDIFRTD